ncbi:hypothetical protein F5050DRAFT_1582211, partial [Lentinula boryana]
YLIHWKDQPDSEDSWVNLTELPTPTDELVDRFHRRHPRSKRPPASVLSATRHNVSTRQSDNIEIDYADVSRPIPPISNRRSPSPTPINSNLRTSYTPPLQTTTRSGRTAKPPTRLNL